MHGEPCGARHSVNERFDGLHANEDARLAGGGRDVGMPCHEFDARFEFRHDSPDPAGLHDAVGVGKTQNLPVAGLDEAAQGVLLGAHPLGNFLDGEHVEPRVTGGVFGQDFRGVVVAAVVGDPDVPLPVVVLC